jgi:hypothetical protein
LIGSANLHYSSEPLTADQELMMAEICGRRTVQTRAPFSNATRAVPAAYSLVEDVREISWGKLTEVKTAAATIGGC